MTACVLIVAFATGAIVGKSAEFLFNVLRDDIRERRERRKR